MKVAYEHNAIDSIPLSPEIARKDNPRPSFTEDEYKLLLKTTRDVVEEGVKVRGCVQSSEIALGPEDGSAHGGGASLSLSA